MSAPRFAELPRNQILVGDARERLAELPDASVDCVVTSPPYFALRDYGQPGQLGLEATVEAWVEELRAVGREIQRVLKATGSFWVNVGDSYSHHPREGAPKKSLLLGPSRLALALVADGWLLRNHVVWAKANPMPCNVTDRLSCTHECVYFFTRSQRYYFDLNAIRESHKAERVRTSRAGNHDEVYPPPGVLPRRSARAHDINSGLVKLKKAGLAGHPLGKNPGDVWSVATACYHGAHFATFPVELLRRPILSTCPAKLCSSCGTPWTRTKQAVNGRLLATGPLRPGCRCGGEARPGVVLDPFIGAGTVALAAEEHGRNWVGIELNPDYAQLAQQRLADWRAKHTNTKENNH